MSAGHVVFVVNLLQDINILRPLAYLVSQELNLNTRFLVTAAFRTRDKTGLWQQELSEIATDTQSSIHDFENEFQALQVLQTDHGVLIAGSESHLYAHKPVHDLFRIAPSKYVKVTLQHGFECVGFLQSRDQNLAHGSNITFAADIICGWCAPERLTAIAPSQRHKLKVTGPTSLLSSNGKSPKVTSLIPAERGVMGLICENMHSPRLNVAGDFKSQFLEIFPKFCAELEKEGRRVTLRPHPGGQYVIKNDVPIPENASLENAPIYKIDLGRFAYGISAPSSILIDMVLAGIPTAVWHDEDCNMDLSNYEGLTRISYAEDWIKFALEAENNPKPFLEKQDIFLKRNRLVNDRGLVYASYHNLISSCANLYNGESNRFKLDINKCNGFVRDNNKSDICNLRGESDVIIRGSHRLAAKRILFVANANIPTLQISFIEPLKPFIDGGTIKTEILLEKQITIKLWKKEGYRSPESWVINRVSSFEPTIIVFCRYSGPFAEEIISLAKQHNIPIVFHIDDDLLNVPKELGAKKYEYHNQPSRINTIRLLLDLSDIVYASTKELASRLRYLGAKSEVRAGEIVCPGRLLTLPSFKQIRKVGYMGIGHEEDLASILPPLVKYLIRNPQVTFELFGTIPFPKELEILKDRVKIFPKIDDYSTFLRKMAELKWDIGICPLAPFEFNKYKANNKWVEYTSVGTAVIATRGYVYDECCSGGCGILANTHDDWFSALNSLTRKPVERYKMVLSAQEKLGSEYTEQLLRDQIFRIFDESKTWCSFLNERHNLSSTFLSEQTVKKIFIVSNTLSASLQACILLPLRGLIKSGKVVTEVLTEKDLKSGLWRDFGYKSSLDYIIDKFVNFSPDLIVFCRYSGPGSIELINEAKKNHLPSVFFIDDDLFNVGEEAGIDKYSYHNNPKRINRVLNIIRDCNLIYCSTNLLKQRLISYGIKKPILNGRTHVFANIKVKASKRPCYKIGYIANKLHSNNMKVAVDAIVEIMQRHKNIIFEIFGDLPVHPDLIKFGDRVKTRLRNDNYEEFECQLAMTNWDIGICPLIVSDFNQCKSNIKWIEYSKIGAAVVASAHTVYDECCSEGRGILVKDMHQWVDALNRLIIDDEYRFEMSKRAQQTLIENYSEISVQQQLVAIFSATERLQKENQYE